MAIRTFIFCDICNPQAIRIPEARRSFKRENEGRRIFDGRKWFEGAIEDAVGNFGWLVTDDDMHICPCCQLIVNTSREQA